MAALAGWVRRILFWLAGTLAVLVGLGFLLLYAPAPAEPELGGRFARETLTAGGRTRDYLVYAPADLPAAPPLLIAFHGSMGSPAQMRIATGYGFDRLADRHRFIVAYPQGFEGNWNDCRRAAEYAARRRNVDDLGFFDALVGRLVRERHVNPARIFVVGLSSGGHFVFRLALERPDRIAGAAIFAANLPTDANNVCIERGTPPPVLFVNGTSDPINPYDGGAVTLFGFGNRGAVRSAQDSARWFAARRGAVGPTISRIDASRRTDPTWVERAEWRSGRGVEVMLMSVHGGGHVAPQPYYQNRRLLGRTTGAIDAPDEAWQFFSRRPSAQSAQE